MLTLNTDQFDEEFVALYREYREHIVKYLSTIIYDSNCVEDLAQDIFVRIYKNGIIPPEGSMFRRNYMLKSARNMAIDYLRKKRIEELRFEKMLPELICNERTVKNDVFNTVIRNFMASRVNEVLAEFPEKKKKIFVDILIDKKKLCDVSGNEELSKYKIRKIELEIFNRLKQQLKDYAD